MIGGQHYDTSKRPRLRRERPRLHHHDPGNGYPSFRAAAGRVAKRAMISLGRVGSFCGNGSGDIAIAFTTANRIPHDSDHDILTCRMFYDESIDKVFETSVEAVEEAIISSLYHAETTHGIRGKTAVSLRDFLNH